MSSVCRYYYFIAAALSYVIAVWMELSGINLMLSELRVKPVLTILPPVVGTIMLVAGIMLRKVDVETSTRDRLLLASLCAPGLVLYHKGYKKEIAPVMFLSFILGIIAMLVPFLIGWPKESGFIALALVFYGSIFAFYSVMWSYIWVNDYCNKESLPYCGGRFETDYEDTQKALRIWKTILIILLSVVTIPFVFGCIGLVL